MLSYEKKGTGKETLLLLHGWPGDASKWMNLSELIKDRYLLYIVDLPGWGATPLPRAYTLKDYADEVRDFIVTEKLEKPIIIGHSFGGRVAIKLLSEEPLLAKKLVLIASAGIEQKKWHIRMLAWLSPVMPKPLRNFARSLFASPDYRGLEGVKRETFKNIVSEDLRPLLPRLSLPTLLVWGDEDHTTPLSDGRIMEQEIPHAKLVVIPGGDHGIPYRKSSEVARAIISFVC